MKTLALILSLWAGTAGAQYFTGNQLNEVCAWFEPNKRDTDTALCVAYTAGVLDALNGLQLGYCIPAGVTLGQLGSIVSKFMRNYPESLHSNGSLIVGYAMIQAFPCAEKPRTPRPKKEKM